MKQRLSISPSRNLQFLQRSIINYKGDIMLIPIKDNAVHGTVVAFDSWTGERKWSCPYKYNQAEEFYTEYYGDYAEKKCACPEECMERVATKCAEFVLEPTSPEQTDNDLASHENYFSPQVQ